MCHDMMQTLKNQSPHFTLKQSFGTKTFGFPSWSVNAFPTSKRTETCDASSRKWTFLDIGIASAFTILYSNTNFQYCEWTCSLATLKIVLIFLVSNTSYIKTIHVGILFFILLHSTNTVFSKNLSLLY